MRWAVIEFTHYTGDDTMFENFADDDFQVTVADTLSEVISQLSGSTPLVRIDDGDSPYGGVYTHAQDADYFDLDDFARSNVLCWGIFAESVLDRNFNAMKRWS